MSIHECGAELEPLDVYFSPDLLSLLVLLFLFAHGVSELAGDRFRRLVPLVATYRVRRIEEGEQVGAEKFDTASKRESGSREEGRDSDNEESSDESGENRHAASSVYTGLALDASTGVGVAPPPADGWRLYEKYGAELSIGFVADVELRSHTWCLCEVIGETSTSLHDECGTTARDRCQQCR